MPVPKITIELIREAIKRGLPALELIAGLTANKYDDLAVAILKLIVTDDKIAEMIKDALVAQQGASQAASV